MDGILLNGLIRSLKPLEGARIGKIQNVNEYEVVFHVHGSNISDSRLLINVHSNAGRIYATSRRVETAPEPDNFVMVLRKYSSQSIIMSIEQRDYDRIVVITLRGHNELQDEVVYELVVELMGKYSNLILVEKESRKIIDLYKRIPVFENSKRLLHPGAIYDFPDKPLRQTIDQDLVIDQKRSLVSQIEGFSPMLSAEVLDRLHKGEDLNDIIAELKTSKTLYQYPKESHLIEMRHLGEPISVRPLMEGLASLDLDLQREARLHQAGKDLFRTVNNEIKKSKKKIRKLEASLEDAKNYDIYRQYGDLLLTWADQLEREPVVKLESFETGEMLSIPIDMRYDLKTNSKLYYKKYRKQKRAIDILQEQIAQARSDLSYFEQLEWQCSEAGFKEQDEIRQELISLRLLPVAKKVQPKKGKKAMKLTCIALGDDARILVGKNNLQNQALTWNRARKNDLWFHTQGFHGSHVILQSENPTEEEIRSAAMLAAWFSQAKHSSSVPVDYTKVSALKKVPGSKAGFVTMKTYSTIYIDPEEEAITALLDSAKLA